MNRREFLTGTTAALGLAALGPGALAQTLPKRAEPRFVGIHIAAHSFYDEGLDHCLDFLQETAGVNALFVTSNSYYGAMFRPKEAQGDHGRPIRDGRGRTVTRVFFQPHEGFYTKTRLRHKRPQPGLEYAGREIYTDLGEPARKRGMKVYERMYEPGADGLLPSVSHAEQVLTVDIHGKHGQRPCWNHPEYLHFVEAWVRDLFASYPLHGIQFGAERNGPLSRLMDWANEDPTCFCPFCRRRAKREGVDFERAKTGLIRIAGFVRSLQSGHSAGADGVLVSFMRLLLENPEILAWEQMHYRAGEELHQRIYKTIKSVRPDAQVGRHLDHAQTSWDLLYRAAMPYNRLTACSDFLKISTYNEILGPRLAGRVDGWRKHILSELSPNQALGLFYAAAGHNAAREPGMESLAQAGLSPEYVFRETRRAVEGVAGASQVYPGIAIDIPRGSGWGSEASPSDPHRVYQCVRRALDAGAGGIVICREYEENRRESLQSIGRAVRDFESLNR